MELYHLFFDQERKELPYSSDEEAQEDILTLVDCFVKAAFVGKDLEGGRLEMRGVVVTPQECQEALQERMLFCRQEYKEGSGLAADINKELAEAKKHVNSRREASGSFGVPLRLWRLTENFCLNPLEEFCFYLAFAVDWDRKYERLFGYLQDNVAAKLPTVGLGISLYGLGYDIKENSQAWIGWDSPLWEHLLCLDSEENRKESRLSRPLVLREAVFHYLRGEDKFFNEIGENYLGSGAVRVSGAFDWEDLILEDSQKGLLCQLCGQLKYRHTVMEKWGFGKNSPYGNGLSALFYGAPGTGKTMAAQVVANQLGMELYKIDISQLVSKYIGETEKNLRQLFDRASKSNAVLFFDEADSLFAKRTEVGSSNDRYANMETGFLLQKFEEYSGVSILATNYINNIDDAFKRRLKFIIRFSFPSAAVRLKLWESMIPPKAQLMEELNLGFYAHQFELAGSSIKEVIMSAAYLAASGEGGIGNCHIKEALSVYFAKYGRHVTSHDFEGEY